MTSIPLYQGLILAAMLFTLGLVGFDRAPQYFLYVDVH